MKNVTLKIAKISKNKDYSLFAKQIAFGWIVPSVGPNSNVNVEATCTKSCIGRLFYQGEKEAPYM